MRAKLSIGEFSVNQFGHDEFSKGQSGHVHLASTNFTIVNFVNGNWANSNLDNNWEKSLRNLRAQMRKYVKIDIFDRLTVIYGFL